MKRNSQRGVALVITLILLSVITFMAVTFLVVSRRGGEQVSTDTRQEIARQAADQGLEWAQSHVIANMLGRGNGFDFSFFVSTNYQSSTAFIPGNPSITNVNYNGPTGPFWSTNASLNSAQLLADTNYQQMLANQMILPRPPVFIADRNGQVDFRYYLDMNRNRTNDPSGIVSVIDQFGTNLQNAVGDPEWIGVLEHPDQPHSANNRFIARYVVMAIPIGNALDANAIHNNALHVPGFGPGGFLRNEGVGSWEINLGGFFNGLNPAVWDYEYNPAGITDGAAFRDASDILRYRYNGSFGNLSGSASTYGVPLNFFRQSGIDGYCAGPLMGGFTLPGVNYDSTIPFWSGADNPARLFTSQDYFNAPNSPFLVGFSNRLAGLSANLASSFDRYTYYRMLSQLGVDSAPEDTNKLNLNYNKVGAVTSTNLMPWTNALEFFTNAADRLLAAQPDLSSNALNLPTNLSTHFIPVYPTNYYTPAVHRLLQVAANIGDATGVQPFDANFATDQLSYPSVYRPTFTNVVIGGVTNIVINGFTNTVFFNHPVPISALLDSSVDPTTANLYDIPWVVAARKGFPNLNKVDLQATFSLTRKLQIVKNRSNPTDQRQYHTNIQYVLGISNNVAVQAWNSYNRDYPRGVNIICFDETDVGLTNQAGFIPLLAPLSNHYTNATNLAVFPGSWSRYPGGSVGPNVKKSFDVVILATNALLPTAAIHPNNTFTLVSPDKTIPANFDTTTGYPQPTFGLALTNRLWFYMLDAATGRVIDYAQFTTTPSAQDLMSEIGGPNEDYGPGDVWDTNRLDGTTNVTVPILGIQNQVQASQTPPPFTPAGYNNPKQLTVVDWQNAGVPAGSVGKEVKDFNDFYNNNSGGDPSQSKQVPYSPTRSVSVYYTFQANDPLVHYMASDLTGGGELYSAAITNKDATIADHIQQHLFAPNSRYLPWGGAGNTQSDVQAYSNYFFNPALVDPQVTRSDDWQFPTNRFPNIGWLGRVHRGTPWQTIYMKSMPVDISQNYWMNWTGDANPADRNILELNTTPPHLFSEPTNDWAIFDLFTTALNDNSTRGQLSVNQTNYAAWESVMAGAIVVTNTDPNDPTIYGPLIIDPNSNSAAMVQIVSDINANRANFPGGVFTRMGDILSTPSLTVNSPFLNTNGVDPANYPSDLAFERLPQQIMSLLRVGSPRYVIYTYGQSLKPADRSIVTSGPFFQMCVNYQITGEVATRTVVRFEAQNPSQEFDRHNPTHNPVMPRPFNGRNDQHPPRAVIESYVVLPPE